MDDTMKNRIDTLIFDGLKAENSFRKIIDDLNRVTGVQLAVSDLNNQITICAPIEKNEGWLSFFDESSPALSSPEIRMRILSLFSETDSVRFDPGELDEHYVICRPVLLNGVPDAIAIARYPSAEDEKTAALAVSALSRLYSFFIKTNFMVGQSGDVFAAGLSKALLLGSDKNSFLSTVHAMYSYGVKLLTAGYIIIDIREKDGESSEKLKIAEKELGDIFENSFRLIADGCLLSLLHSLDLSCADLSDRIAAQLTPFLERYSFYAGISLPFSDLEARSDYKYQARQARRIGSACNPDKNVFSAERLLPEILFSAAIDTAGLNVLELSDIRRLDSYDKEHHTSYLDTLEAYLLNGHHISVTARKLFLNRGTLTYRLQKISELLEKDIDDPAISKILIRGISVYRLGSLV